MSFCKRFFAFAAFVLASGFLFSSSPAAADPNDDSSDPSSFRTRLFPIDLPGDAARLRGQTSFLEIRNASLESFRPMMAMASMAVGGMAPESASSDSRAAAPADRGAAVQSDVWVDAPAAADGTRIRYIAHEDEGLLVVRPGSKDLSPLLRRIPLGFSPKKLLIADPNLLILLEEGTQEDSTGKMVTVSRVVTFDISNPEVPNLVSTLTENNLSVSDAFRVGKALYILYKQKGADQKETAVVASYGFVQDGSGKTICRNVGRQNLNSRVTANEPLSVVQGPNGTYHVVAITKASGGQPIVNRTRERATRESGRVEVLDISDPNGRIGSSITLVAQGVVNSTGWVGISGGRAVVASSAARSGLHKPAMILELFDLGPSAQNRSAQPAIDSDRHSFLAYALANGLEVRKRSEDPENEPPAPFLDLASLVYGARVNASSTGGGVVSPLPLNQVRTTWNSSNDQPLQILDLKFVEAADGSSHVILATHGAIISFAVDVTNTEKPFRRENRIFTEGSIYRVFPVRFGDQSYLLSLGNFSESLDNVTGETEVRLQLYRQRPSGGIEEVGQPLSLPSNITVDYSKPSLKYFIDVNQATGEAFIALEASFLAKKPDEAQQVGAQIVKMTLGDAPQLRRGRSVTGEGFDMTRFMAGSPVAVATDLQMVAYPGMNARSLGDETVNMHEAITQTVELARLFEGTAWLGSEAGDASFVQIVRDPKLKGVFLRLSSLEAADAHLDQVFSNTLVEGEYYAHSVVRLPQGQEHGLLLQTVKHISEQNRFTTVDRFTLWVSRDGRLVQVAQAESAREYENASDSDNHEVFRGEAFISSPAPQPAAPSDQYMVEGMSGRPLFAIHQSKGVSRFVTQDAMSSKMLALEVKKAEPASEHEFAIVVSRAAPIAGLDAAISEIRTRVADLNQTPAKNIGISWRVKAISGKLFAYVNVGIAKAPQKRGVSHFSDTMQYSRSFIARLESEDGVNWSVVGRAMNIPGTPVMMTLGGVLITEDTEHVVSAIGRNDEKRESVLVDVTTTHNFHGLSLTDGLATLVGSAQVPSGIRVDLQDRIVFVANTPSGLGSGFSTTVFTGDESTGFGTQTFPIVGLQLAGASARTRARDNSREEGLRVFHAGHSVQNIREGRDIKSIRDLVVLAAADGALYPIEISHHGIARVLTASVATESGPAAVPGERWTLAAGQRVGNSFTGYHVGPANQGFDTTGAVPRVYLNVDAGGQGTHICEIRLGAPNPRVAKE